MLIHFPFSQTKNNSHKFASSESNRVRPCTLQLWWQSWRTFDEDGRWSEGLNQGFGIYTKFGCAGDGKNNSGVIPGMAVFWFLSLPNPRRKSPTLVFSDGKQYTDFDSANDFASQYLFQGSKMTDSRIYDKALLPALAVVIIRRRKPRQHI